jgi:Uma2 family endonuclease
MTADELLQRPDDGLRHELIRGVLTTLPWSGLERAHLAAMIIGSLGTYVMEHRWGTMLASGAGFHIGRDPDTVRTADAAFIPTDIRTNSFFDGPPHVAFEVVSPSDRYTEVDEKTIEWLNAGTRAVVIVDPSTKSARIHRSGRAVDATDAIVIDDILPGWRLPLAELFA